MQNDGGGSWQRLAHFFEAQKHAGEVAQMHRFFLYGGTRGPGKSYWLRWYLIGRLMSFWARGLQGVRVGLFCEDYPSLKDRQVSKIATEFPAFLGSLRETKSEGLAFHLAPNYGSGILALRNLDDPTKYQSAEFAVIAIDELTKNRESTFHVLRGSLRWPGVPDTQFISASNSNGIGRAWVRKFWIEKDFGDRPELQSLAPEFAYVPALPKENPHLAQSYWSDLDTLPEHLRRSWRDGDWYVPNLGVVYPDFTDANLTDEEPDRVLPIEIAIDDGYQDPRATLIIQRRGSRILVFDELYHSQHLPERCVSEMLAQCQAYGLRRPRYATRSHESPELEDRLRRVNIPSVGAVVPVVDGISFVRSLILDGNGVRTLFVHRRCQNLIRELQEGYVYREDREDEEPMDENNHACDALKNYCWQRVRRAMGARLRRGPTDFEWASDVPAWARPRRIERVKPPAQRSDEEVEQFRAELERRRKASATETGG